MRINRLIVSITMAVVIVVVNGAATYLSYRWDTDAPLSVAITATAILSFIGLLALTQPAQGIWRLTEVTMRTAIAGTIVIEYLVLVATVAFFQRGPQALPPITQTLLSNFTGIVGVVIAFYFGASAYVEAHSKRGTANETSPDNEDRTST